ncbi:MAG: radical SAM protein, partial [Pseudomonadota bacterium]
LMLELQGRGCSNVEAVSPSHQLPGLLEAIAIACEQGLELPLVYNTNAYESPDTLALLDGIVDVFLPDLRYSSNGFARKYSDADDYVETARSAVLEMHRQVGNLVTDSKGTAVGGVILRLLVMPNDISGTRESLIWISKHLPKTFTISLMAQYAPLHDGRHFPEISRRIHDSEYDQAVDMAWDLGFENAFVQEFESQDMGIPDFTSKDPFQWDTDDTQG